MFIALCHKMAERTEFKIWEDEEEMKNQVEIESMLESMKTHAITDVTPENVRLVQGWIASLTWVLSDEVTVSNTETGGEEE